MKLKRIILIDDDDINNYINIQILKKLELAEAIVVKKNGLDAITFIKENYSTILTPTLIILDNMMPIMDGLEFIKEFNKLESVNKEQIVILLLAATVSPEDLKTYFDNGIKEFTSKPLDSETLLRTYNKYWGEDGGRN